MKKQAFLIGFIVMFISEIIALIVFAVQTPDFLQDTVAVNEVMQSVTEDFNALEQHKNTTALDYVILDESATFRDALRFVDGSRYLVLQIYAEKFLDEITEDELYERLLESNLYDRIYKG